MYIYMFTHSPTNVDDRHHCHACDYSTPRKDHFHKHCSSAKHKRMVNMFTGLTKKGKITHNGGSGKSGDLSTFVPNLPGQPSRGSARVLPGGENKKVYVCKCGKVYKWRQSLYVHKKKCTDFVEEDSDSDKDKEIEELKKQLREKDRALAAAEAQRAASEAQRTKADDTIATLSTKVGTTVNVFLNEHCKNAKPIMDFIKDIQFNLSGIIPLDDKTTITSLGNQIVDNLNDMEKTERPIHCSDVKRLKFYVKDASGWEMDENNQKIEKALGWANMRRQACWHKQSQKFAGTDKDDPYHNMNLTLGSWSDDVKKSKKKVLRMIAPKVKIREEANGSFSLAK
jgi:hypothetical protein